MKTNSKKLLHILTLALAVLVFLPGCKKFLGLSRQEDFEYKPQTLDPNINISARQFLENRSYGATPQDTVFKWMRLGLEYAGIDLAEYEKPDRTFIFLHNEAIRRFDGTGKLNGGLFFTYPLAQKDGSGNYIVDPVTGLPKTTAATKWSDYDKETVKNYFLYLIGQGKLNFTDLNNLNKDVQSLLPPNTTATKESLLGWVNGGKGFDQEGKFWLKIRSNDDLGPIVFNDNASDRSAGYIATNGIIHVYGVALQPFRPQQ
ncbi:hypothetical protein [Paraflavitalea sp. CAU 1676]|uniref:hypothetical protein n=1 Tax=Paraflavitalea sp. CAU 1676 TaxID=3032598 RepID=UPI0023D9A7F5|nr:hypothetical protein [Paraflavitalea sp. CAU 1676]MDF2193304.1 hypothetical protein [Paraflavitalea sp. CAU 1676]